jgi:hypothetical protein
MFVHAVLGSWHAAHGMLGTGVACKHEARGKIAGVMRRCRCITIAVLHPPARIEVRRSVPTARQSCVAAPLAMVEQLDVT